jgi:hypothetical protein
MTPATPHEMAMLITHCLRPSTRYHREAAMWCALAPTGLLDHVRCWTDANGALTLTTEPYRDAFDERLLANWREQLAQIGLTVERHRGLWHLDSVLLLVRGAARPHIDPPARRRPTPTDAKRQLRAYLRRSGSDEDVWFGRVWGYMWAFGLDAPSALALVRWRRERVARIVARGAA